MKKQQEVKSSDGRQGIKAEGEESTQQNTSSNADPQREVKRKILGQNPKTRDDDKDK